MARTGPQRIPGAVLDLYFGDGQYSGSDMEVNCGVIHTTEGPSLYSYGSGASAPTVTAVPDFANRRLVWHQHFDVDESARALVNAAGGVQTNLANAFQVELVGTCDPSTHGRWTRDGVQHIYWPEPPDWAVRDLAWLMRWLRDYHGIPLTSGLTFKAYPDSYGASNGARMSFAQWTSFTGWCGHQHVPENLHGDPGALPITRLLAAAAGITTPEEDDMPSAEEIAAAVWAHPLVNPARPAGWTQPAQDFQVDQDRKHDLVMAAIADLAAQIGARSPAVDTAAVVAAVKQAIAEATVRVTVAVAGPTN